MLLVLLVTQQLQLEVPYIKNVTVITKGSVVSASDPRGFDLR